MERQINTMKINVSQVMPPLHTMISSVFTVRSDVYSVGIARSGVVTTQHLSGSEWTNHS